MDDRIKIEQVSVLSESSRRPRDGRTGVSLTSDRHPGNGSEAYVYLFHIMVPDERTHCCENYFDLVGRESAEIVVRNPAMALNPENVTFAWR